MEKVGSFIQPSGKSKLSQTCHSKTVLMLFLQQPLKSLEVVSEWRKMQENLALYLCQHNTHASNFLPLWLVINTHTNPSYAGRTNSKGHEFASQYLPTGPRPFLISGATERLHFFSLDPNTISQSGPVSFYGAGHMSQGIFKSVLHTIDFLYLWIYCDLVTLEILLTKGKCDHPKQNAQL